MTTFDQIRPARRAPAFGAISALLGHLISWNDRRVTVKMLSALTDRELTDIGLARDDIATWSRAR